jgi:hypothetical protein
MDPADGARLRWSLFDTENPFHPFPPALEIGVGGMSYPLEANSAFDDDVGHDGNGLLVGETDDYCDEYEEVDVATMGMDPARPTKAKPGSEEKVMMLAARYAAGLPLWHNGDCMDHGPSRLRREP